MENASDTEDNEEEEEEDNNTNEDAGNSVMSFSTRYLLILPVLF